MRTTTSTDDTYVGGRTFDGARSEIAPVRTLAALALAAFFVSALLIIALDLSAGEYVARQTVSEYFFTHPTLFTLSVVLLVAGSVALTAALARRGVLGITGGTLLGIWVLGMAAVAVFPKHDWSVGPSLSGHIHRIASLAAFFALPVAIAVLTARSWRRGGALLARAGSICALAAALVLGYLVWSVVQSSFTGVPWWQAVQLGVVERLLIGFEVAALAALAVWLLRRPREHTETLAVRA